MERSAGPETRVKISDRMNVIQSISHANSPANILKAYRRQNGFQPHLSEDALLRDMIYILQGIDGRYVYFKRAGSNDEESWEEGGIGFRTDDGLVTLPQRDLILKLSELGWLYKKIESAIGSEPDPNDGIVRQAFRYSLREELGNYYRSIAVIESNLSSSIEQTHLSLKSLLLHLSPTVLRLRMSAALISATKQMSGGQLISVLHSYTDHGDPVVHQFTSNLLEKVSVPWFKSLVSWMWDGELVDPADEFFIKHSQGFDDPQSQLEPTDGWKVWSQKFGFRKEMVPSFISEVFARKVEWQMG